MNFEELIEKFKEDPFFRSAGEELFAATIEVSKLNERYTLYEFAEKRARNHMSAWLRALVDHIDSGGRQLMIAEPPAI